MYASNPSVFLIAKRLPLMLGFALLAGCQGKATGPTYEEMAADHALTRQVLKQCREHRESMSPDTCTAAATAENKWFMGDGKTRYTPTKIRGLDPPAKTEK